MHSIKGVSSAQCRAAVGTLKLADRESYHQKWGFTSCNELHRENLCVVYTCTDGVDFRPHPQGKFVRCIYTYRWCGF